MFSQFSLSAVFMKFVASNWLSHRYFESSEIGLLFTLICGPRTNISYFFTVWFRWLILLKNAPHNQSENESIKSNSSNKKRQDDELQVFVGGLESALIKLRKCYCIKFSRLDHYSRDLKLASYFFRNFWLALYLEATEKRSKISWFFNWFWS